MYRKESIDALINFIGKQECVKLKNDSINLNLKKAFAKKIDKLLDKQSDNKLLLPLGQEILIIAENELNSNDFYENIEVDFLYGQPFPVTVPLENDPMESYYQKVAEHFENNIQNR